LKELIPMKTSRNNLINLMSSTGYEGVDCGTQINECTTPSNPCVHGTCKDLFNDYKCTCHQGESSPVKVSRLFLLLQAVLV
jgi:hypothetical protein